MSFLFYATSGEEVVCIKKNQNSMENLLYDSDPNQNEIYIRYYWPE
jgi:hypothetical protein